jgi:hypothetical protein
VVTDYSELLKRLRERPHRRAHETTVESQERRQKEREDAADALEVQGTRISVLEDLTRELGQECNAEYVRNWELEAENKALREALKPFAAVTEGDLELWYGLDPDPFVPDDAALITIDSSPTVGDLRAARAAMG